jgi:transposase-like protein
MNAETKSPKTLMEAVLHFSNLELAHQFFVDVRWPDGVICPTCGSAGANYNPKYRRFQCNKSHDKRQFTVKTGSVMEDSPLGLDKWAVAFWLEVNAKNSISSYEIHRALGITQKSAWFMLHRIRHALHVGSFDTKFQGVIEADETYVGGKAEFMHKSVKRRKITGGGVKDKTAVMGLLDRHNGKHSTVRAVALEGTASRKIMHEIIHKNVEAGSHVYTDSHAGYVGLKADFVHRFVDHTEKYVEGAVHTNGLENFWTLLKRCIKGTHVSIEPFHIQAYIDSEAFRFNNREVKDADRFNLAVRGYHGKRLTYKSLIGESEGAQGSDNIAGSEPVN